MIVLDKGEGWSKRLLCKGCKAVLVINASDINYKVTDADAARHQYHDEVEGTYYVECPMCAQRLILKPTAIPKPITDRLKATG